MHHQLIARIAIYIKLVEEGEFFVQENQGSCSLFHDEQWSMCVPLYGGKMLHTRRHDIALNERPGERKREGTYTHFSSTPTRNCGTH